MTTPSSLRSAPDEHDLGRGGFGRGGLDHDGLRGEPVRAVTDEDDFERHFRRHILPLGETYERKRAALHRRIQRRAWLRAPLLVVLPAAAILLALPLDPVSGVAGGALVAIVVLAWAHAPGTNYRQVIKAGVFPHVFSYLGTFRYEPTARGNLDDLRHFDLLPSHSGVASEDHIVGEHRGVPIEMFQADLVRRAGRGNGVQRHRVFKGVVVRVQLARNVVGRTIVRTDRGLVGNRVRRFWSSVKMLDRVALEDPTFERMFEVFSSDQVEARTLLSPTFMERLVRLQGTFGSETLQCAFHGGEALFLLSGDHRRFEVGAFEEPIDFRSDAFRLLTELREVLNIVDVLRLERRPSL